MLQLSDIEAGYKGLQVIKSINMEVMQGEVVALIGNNGAGKTTLIKTISGLVQVKSGNINFFGTEINSLTPDARVRMGIAHIPEGRHVFPQMSVEENMLVGAYLIADRMRISQNMSDMFSIFPQLHERRKKLAKTLSGGERQMLAIARGLMSNPKLLLMDEPSLGLAPKIAEEVGRIILNLRKKGVTILLVEQNANMALRLADRGYVLEVGKIVMEGEGEKLIHEDYVKQAYLGVT